MPRRRGHHARSRSRSPWSGDSDNASSTRSDDSGYTFGSSTSSGHSYDTTPEDARFPGNSDDDTIREEGEVASDHEDDHLDFLDWANAEVGQPAQRYPSPESIRTISPEPLPNGEMERQREEIRSLKRQLEKSKKKAEKAEDDYHRDRRHKRHLQYKIRRLKDENHRKNEKIASLDYQRRRLIEENDELEEENEYLSDVSQQYFLSKEKERSTRKSTARHLERKRKECATLKSEIRTVKDRQETARELDAARNRANNYRQLMLNMSELLHQDAEQRQGAEPPAWKTCEICIREFEDHGDMTPRVLTGCGHTICHSCVESLEAQGQEDNGIRCPFDRTLTTFPDGSPNNLPKNYALLRL